MRDIIKQKKNASNESIYSVKKPSTPHVMDSQIELTEQEHKKRMFVDEQLSELGISTSIFDANKDGREDSDVLEAIIIANRGEVIPDDLKMRIKSKYNVELPEEEKSSSRVEQN